MAHNVSDDWFPVPGAKEFIVSLASRIENLESRLQKIDGEGPAEGPWVKVYDNNGVRVYQRELVHAEDGTRRMEDRIEIHRYPNPPSSIYDHIVADGTRDGWGIDPLTDPYYIAREKWEKELGILDEHFAVRDSLHKGIWSGDCLAWREDIPKYWIMRDGLMDSGGVMDKTHDNYTEYWEWYTKGWEHPKCHYDYWKINRYSEIKQYLLHDSEHFSMDALRYWARTEWIDRVSHEELLRKVKELATTVVTNPSS